MFVRLTILAIAATIPAVSLAAQEPSAPTASDPNEKICENLSQIGSRLSKKRICATRAEWTERRLQDRKDAEAIQQRLNGSTCAGVKTNGVPIC
jgi:hypothetical protein